MASSLQEAETAHSSGAPEVGVSMFICFFFFFVFFLFLFFFSLVSVLFLSCPCCSPELSVIGDFPLP